MRAIFILLTLGCPIYTWADCSALAENTPDSQFTIKADGSIVRDNKTGLHWQRCSLGQTWNAVHSRCDPTTTARWFSWQQALDAASANRLAGFTNWRLPNKKELASLLELSCSQPAINSRIFPNTAVGRYWTSTPVPYADSFTAWFVDFTYGDYGNLAVTQDTLSVRLVRDAE